MKILVLIKDFEKLFDVASLYSKLQIFKTDRLEIDLYHNFVPYKQSRSPDVSEAIKLINDQEMEVRKRKLNLRKDLVQKSIAGANATVSALAQQGDFKDNLASQLGKKEYDLVIVNPSAHKNIAAFFTDRNMTWLIDQSLVPILIIPEVLSEEPYGSVISLISSDKMYQQYQQTEMVSQLNKPRLLHFGDRVSSPDVEKINSDDPHNSIVEFMKANPKDLYVIKHKSLNVVLSLFQRSLAKSLTTNLEASLLVL